MKGGDNMQNIVINSSMNLGKTLPKVMKINRQTTTSLGNAIGYTQSYVSKVKNGKASFQFDVITALLKALPEQNELLALDIAHQITGFIPPVATGKGIKGNSETFNNRTIRELIEAMDAMKASEDEFEKPAEMVHDLTDPDRAVSEMLDALFFGLNAVIVFSHEYDLDLCRMEQKREQIWKKDRLL